MGIWDVFQRSHKHSYILLTKCLGWCDNVEKHPAPLSCFLENIMIQPYSFWGSKRSNSNITSPPRVLGIYGSAETFMETAVSSKQSTDRVGASTAPWSWVTLWAPGSPVSSQPSKQAGMWIGYCKSLLVVKECVNMMHPVFLRGSATLIMITLQRKLYFLPV